MSDKPNVAIDFDGVLNDYSGWAGDEELFKPREGVTDFLAKLADHYEVWILTTRKPAMVHNWLVEHGLRRYVGTITNIKPPALAYVDDRAVRFHGDYQQVLHEIEEPAHWQKGPG